MKSVEFIEKVLPVNKKLYRFAFRMLSNKEEAEDIVQETYVRLWNKRLKLSEYRNIDALAMVITKNLCLDHLKLNNRNVMTEEVHSHSSDQVSPYKETELADSVMNVNQIINLLPDQQKMIIQLRDIEGYSFEEIADIMDLNINAIRVTLSRARKTVRDTLTKKYDYELKRN